MTEGMVTRRFTAALALAALVLALLTPPFARASGSPIAQSVTVLAVTEKTLQVTGSDGRAFTLAITSASLFLRRGLLVSAGEFTPGETALLRQRAGAGGRAQVVLLSDPDSAAVIEKYRRRPLTGTLLSAASGAWVVQPSDAPDGVPLTLRLSSRTQYHAGGASVPASAFGSGALVTVTTRGLADGLLLAVSAAEASETPAAPTETRGARFVSGLVLEVQPEAGTVTVQDKAGEQRVVGVDAGTRIKVRRQAATLPDIQPGMRVSAWLGAAQDGSGNPIATSVSALEAAPVKRKKYP